MAYEYIFSFITLASGIYGHYATFTPPAAASSKEREAAADSIGRTRFTGRTLNLLFSPLYYTHLFLELYGIYMSGTSRQSSIPSFICPPKFTHPERIYQPNGYLTSAIVFACVAMAVGGAIRVSCYSSLGHMFRWEISIQSSHKLITTGPYSIVRHPSYPGLAFTTLGYLILLFAKNTVLHECIVPGIGRWIIWIIWSMVLFRSWGVYWLFSRTIAEDRLLKKEFGEQWEQWAAKTKYRCVPYVF